MPDLPNYLICLSMVSFKVLQRADACVVGYFEGIASSIVGMDLETTISFINMIRRGSEEWLSAGFGLRPLSRMPTCGVRYKV
jgi:hypothetical protein